MYRPSSRRLYRCACLWPLENKSNLNPSLFFGSSHPRLHVFADKMPMRPLLLKGHQGPVSKILYNRSTFFSVCKNACCSLLLFADALRFVCCCREGDLIFTAARKDKLPCVWYADNGERIGNYEGHEGAVVDLDVDCKSMLARVSDLAQTYLNTLCVSFVHSIAHCIGRSQSHSVGCWIGQGARIHSIVVPIYN